MFDYDIGNGPLLGIYKVCGTRLLYIWETILSFKFLSK